MESDLKEDIVSVKLFDFSRDWVFMCWQFWSWKCLIFCFENNKKVHYCLNFCVLFIYFILHFTHIFERNKSSCKSGFSPIYKHLVHFSWFKKKSTTRIVVWSHYLNLCELQIENK
jgi:hypothetical protein